MGTAQRLEQRPIASKRAEINVISKRGLATF
jgi:hypothetical protein